MSGASAIAAGYHHSLAVKDGIVVAWGDPDEHKAVTNVSYFATLGDVTAVSAGEILSMALRGGGTGGVVVWGDPALTNVPTEARSGVTAIAAGAYHALAIKDGGIIAWGAPNYDRGQSTVPSHLTSGVGAVDGGAYFTVALKNDGGVEVFGLPNDDDNPDNYGITTVPEELSSGVTKIAAGHYHALALKNGGVVQWGWTPDPVPLEAQSGVTAIAAGYDFSMALKEDGSLVIWGYGAYVNQLTNMPAYVDEGLVDISAGSKFCLTRGGGLPPRWVSDQFPLYVNPGYNYRGQLVATGFPDVVYSNVTNRWPAWLSVNPVTGVVSGSVPITEEHDRAYTISVVASNIYGAFTNAYTINITTNPISPPVFVTTNVPNGTVGVYYEVQIEAEPWPLFSVVEGQGSGLPPGLTLSQDGLLFGTPTEVYDAYFMLQALNTAGTNRQTFTMTVSMGLPQIITTSPLPPATNGAAYSLALEAIGSPVFSLGSGSLPTGLTMDATGVITGTPTGEGGSTFGITVSNEVGATTSYFLLEVYTAPAITTTNLPDGVIDVAYSQTIALTGYPTPVLSISSGTLPVDLTLSGNTLTGTPTTGGEYTFSLRASNAVGTVTAGYTLVIGDELLKPKFTSITRGENGKIKLEWENPNAGAGTKLFVASNIFPTATVVWTNLDVQVSPYQMDIQTNRPLYYRLEPSR